jgi:hypothetical protein
MVSACASEPSAGVITQTTPTMSLVISYSCARACAPFSAHFSHITYMYARLKLTHDVADQDQGTRRCIAAAPLIAKSRMAHPHAVARFPSTLGSSSPCAPPRTHSLQYNFGLCTTTFAARCHLRSVPNFVTFWKPPRFPI